MIESTFNLISEQARDDPELDDRTLQQLDSLNSLLSALAHQPVPGANVRDFAIPALLGDGDGISRWMVALTNVRNLLHIQRLRADLTRNPWCIAARVIEFRADEIRMGVTTTRNIQPDQVHSAISALLDCNGETSIQVQQVAREASAGSWVTTTEAANRLGVKPRTVSRWIELGLVVAKQAQTTRGKEWLIRTGHSFMNDPVGV